MTRSRLVTEALLATIVFAVSGALSQSPSPTIRGSWSATAGPNQILQGTWTAELTAANPNGAQG